MHEKFAAMLLGNTPSEFSKERLQTWAKTASHRFINDSIPLNDTIQKIAQDNELNKNHIERICEMANMQTHRSLIPRVPEERAGFTFPLANAKLIILRLNKTGKPVCKMLSDYTRPPSTLPGKGPSIAQLFGVEDAEANHNGAEPSNRQKLVILIEKKASLRNRIHSAMLKSAMEYETALSKFHHTAKQSMMNGFSVDEIYKAACNAGYGNIAQEVLPKTMDLLNKQQFLKAAGQEVPESLIDYNVPVRVINGNHELIASLDTIKKTRDNTAKLRAGLTQVDRDLEICRSRLKEL